MILILILSSCNTGLRNFCQIQMGTQCAPIITSMFHAIDDTRLAVGIDTSPYFPTSSGRGSIFPISLDDKSLPSLKLTEQLYVLSILGRIGSGSVPLLTLAKGKKKKKKKKNKKNKSGDFKNYERSPT